MHTLAETPAGGLVRIKVLNHHLPEVTIRLREMGLRENSLVRCILHGNGNLICEVQNTRIGIDHRLASSILVSALEE